MDKDRKLYIEYFEFLVLGILFFLALYSLFMFKASVVCVNTKMNKNEVDLPSKGYEQIINQQSQTSIVPHMTVVEESNTPYRYEDDVVSYNSSYYSIMLPYDLSHYTDKYGANEASRKLLFALKQLFDQIMQNKMLQTSQEINSFNEMIFICEEMVSNEDLIYNYLKLPDDLKNDTKHLAIKDKINQIDPLNGKYSLLLKSKEEQVVQYLIKTRTNNAQEAVIIIQNINQHLLILSKRTISDFNFINQGKSYDYIKNAKPPIYNIIDKINDDLSKKTSL